MTRLLFLIAVLLAFASLSGPAVAHVLTAHQVGDAGGQCLEQVAVQYEPQLFRSCSKKVNGRVTPCQQQPAVLPLLGATPAWFTRPRFTGKSDTSSTAPLIEGWFRPPRG